MAKRRTTRYIVIHTAATKPSMVNVDAKEINRWHKARGWSGIGYHFVIKRNGALERGRQQDEVGAHVAGHNSNSIGICLVGGLSDKAPFGPENNYTPEQWRTLKALCKRLVAIYPGATILGHRDFPRVAKACPCFDAREWARANGLPAAPNLRMPAKTASLSLGSFGGEAGLSEVTDTLNSPPDVLSPVLEPARETLAQMAAFTSWAEVGLAVIGVLAGAWAVYMAGRAAWAWWQSRNENSGEATDAQ